MSEELPEWLGGGCVSRMSIEGSGRAIEAMMGVLWRSAEFGVPETRTYRTGEFSRWCGWQLERLTDLMPALPQGVDRESLGGPQRDRLWALCAEPSAECAELPAVVDELAKVLEVLASAHCQFANRNLVAWAQSAGRQLKELQRG